MKLDDVPINELTKEGDALDQSIALNRITLSLLQSQKESNKRMFKIIIALIIAFVVMFGAFLYYASQWENVEEVAETITTTQEVSGEDAEINNVQGNQYNDNSVHNEGVGD